MKELISYLKDDLLPWVKVIFGGLCFLALPFSALAGVWDLTGNFISDPEDRGIVSALILAVAGWGYYRFEKDWRHHGY